MKKARKRSHHRFAETLRHSLRDGVTVCFVLSLVIGFLVTIPGVMRQHCHRVDASVEAPRPHDFAVRKPHRSSGDTVSGHRIPRSTVVTTRPPLLSERETHEELAVICPTGQAEILSSGH